MKSSGSGFKSESNKTENNTVVYSVELIYELKVDDLIYNGLTTLAHVCLKSKVNIFSVKISLKNQKYLVI